MQRSCNLNLQQVRELVAVRHGAYFFSQALKDDVRIVGAAEKGAVNALGSPLDQWRRCPNQDNSKYCAQSHSDICIRAKESREDVGEERDGGSRNHEHQYDKAPLHQKVARAASEQRSEERR